MTYIFAGGIGMFVQDLLIKIVITTVALTFASRFVHRYKVWNEKNENLKTNEARRFLRFLADGFKRNYEEHCDDK
tara:strand:- start:504 stop:728 length:225 start_codon:yes stop_codon:yes gene_type:complete